MRSRGGGPIEDVTTSNVGEITVELVLAETRECHAEWLPRWRRSPLLRNPDAWAAILGDSLVSAPDRRALATLAATPMRSPTMAVEPCKNVESLSAPCAKAS